MQQAHMGAYPPHNVTTELIQKYLDENKQLILAILDNQNLGKLNECAAYQAKLQANLMYLAAIADSQPQLPTVHAAQVPQASVLQQPGLRYMGQQQQQIAAQQSSVAARSSAQYSQQSYPFLHQAHHQQQIMQGPHGMTMGGSTSHVGISSEVAMGGNNSMSSGGYPDFVRGHLGSNSGVPISRGLSGGFKSDLLTSGGGNNGGHSSGHVGDESETSYLKASEEEGN